MTYYITDKNLHIENSHSIGKFSMWKELKLLKSTYPKSAVFKRSLSSLYLEWICHNFLYQIGYERERTGSVDLDTPCDHHEWMYVVGGIAVWLFTFKTK